MNEPIDIEASSERWWQMLAEVDAFLANGAPDEALARARAVCDEALDLFLKRPDLERGELAELRTAAALARDRSLDARRAWSRTVSEREATFREREQRAIEGLPVPDR